MSKTIQIGGVGKSPAIEKINRLNAISSRMEAAAKLEQAIFHSEEEGVRERTEKRQWIRTHFSIDFKNKEGNR